ncbi:predicted protein [Histoplasma capsulatum G186AR]|uniref:Uncharacterized protein n=1 Tax=Ajellomyces capsulatus (strain G186AR / H82 / ATCC MYA-2454 / RMSCC 2432) TaxID=447093 RepID=C0NXL6_AJECG|nr:uncharacterized protein HCBG_08208 [Histoplasma capsulatum G186AR]EEH04082.1 predicted protein [Histoplasma capsulatum G186AR]
MAWDATAGVSLEYQTKPKVTETTFFAFALPLQRSRLDSSMGIRKIILHPHTSLARWPAVQSQTPSQNPVFDAGCLPMLFPPWFRPSTLYCRCRSIEVSKYQSIEVSTSHAAGSGSQAPGQAERGSGIKSLVTQHVQWRTSISDAMAPSSCLGCGCVLNGPGGCRWFKADHGWKCAEISILGIRLTAAVLQCSSAPGPGFRLGV